MKTTAKPQTDLDIFIKQFDHERTKVTSKGLEVRSRKERLDNDLQYARNIISKYNLSLLVQSTGDMARMGAFLVYEPQENNN